MHTSNIQQTISPVSFGWLIWFSMMIIYSCDFFHDGCGTGYLHWKRIRHIIFHNIKYNVTVGADGRTRMKMMISEHLSAHHATLIAFVTLLSLIRGSGEEGRRWAHKNYPSDESCCKIISWWPACSLHSPVITLPQCTSDLFCLRPSCTVLFK